MNSYHIELKNEGVVVIPSAFAVADLDGLRAEFEAALVGFPEYRQHPSLSEVSMDLRYCGGGTSFLGSPSVFHNAFSRSMRDRCMFELIELLFRPYVRELLTPEFGLEQCPCRMLVRPPGATPTAETWHRDEAPGADPAAGDVVFGGWINLDRQPQFFSCARRTHLGLDPAARDPKKGFHRLSKEDARAFDAQKRKRKADFHAQHGKRTKFADPALVEVPPGHYVVFVEDLVHEVVKHEPLAYASVRQFLGWRLTTRRDPLMGADRLRRIIDAQGVFPLKSGQMSRAYPKVYQMYPNQFGGLLRALLDSMIDPAHLDKGVFRSLRDLQLPLHPPYLPREIQMLEPARQFTLTNPTTGIPETVLL